MNEQNEIADEGSETNMSKTQNRAQTESLFELVILAAQRTRQLVNGANPRIDVPQKNPRYTYTAIKEVELGLVGFKGNYDE
jgi:DNA-directed RNA polymerase omega subunit